MLYFSKQSWQCCKLTLVLCVGVAVKKHSLYFFLALTWQNCVTSCVLWQRFNFVSYYCLLSLDPISAIDIDPPHAVVIGQEAWFNVTLHSNILAKPEEHSPSYGFVHFMWFFEKDNEEKKKPLLTWDNEVSHTFTTPGTHEVSVTAISVISKQSARVTVTVYG